ncbi:MAG: hypothetical protein AAF629_03825, partial [Chloroflexota bacterium]
MNISKPDQPAWQHYKTVMGGTVDIMDVAIVSNGDTLRLFAVCATGIYQSSSDNPKWINTSDGIQNIDLQAIAASPNFQQDQTLFVGGGQSGLFQSTDAGQNWQPLTGWPIQDTITAIALSPAYAQDSTLLITTLQEGVYLSTDAGVNWKSVNFGIPNTFLLDVKISPNYLVDKTAFIVADDGLYWTKNGAKAWREVRGFPSDTPQSLAFSPCFSQDQTMFLATEDMGVLRSYNGGKKWQKGNDVGAKAIINTVVVSPYFEKDD